MKKLSICLRLLLITMVITNLLGLASCKKVKFDENKKIITIGLECAYAPFNWTETNASSTNYQINNTNLYAEGYDVQIAKMIANDLGYKLVIEKIDWDGLVPALESGKIDAIIAGMSPTAKRKEAINFSNEYYHSNHVLLLKKSSVYVNATTFDDLTNASVMGQKSTVYDTLAKQICEKNTTCKYKNALSSVPEILMAINSGTVDLTIVEEPVAKGIVASNSEYTYISLTTKFDVAPEDVIVSIGIRKIDTTLLNRINEALSKISNETRNTLMENAVQANQA